jgi:hypothetical protein
MQLTRVCCHSADSRAAAGAGFDRRVLERQEEEERQREERRERKRERRVRGLATRLIQALACTPLLHCLASTVLHAREHASLGGRCVSSSALHVVWKTRVDWVCGCA